jgi:ATP-dependent Clp protease adapter protein ClpS
MDVLSSLTHREYSLATETETETDTEIIPEILPSIEPDEVTEPTPEKSPPGGSGDGYRVLLYDDDHHSMDEVAAQIHKATQYPPLQCWAIMLEAHLKGRAICYKGSREKCHRVTKVLREIRLQCEVDCD